MPVATRAPTGALAALVVVRMADEGAAFLPAGTLESFRSDLGLSYAEAGTVLAMIAPGGVLGALGSAAADHVSRRVIAAAGAFGYAASLAGFALAESFVIFSAAALVMGMASTAMVDAAEVALVDLAGEDLRRYLARSNFLGALGDALGPALITFVAVAGWSWRIAFGAGAVVMVVYGVVLAATELPPPAPKNDGGAGGEAEAVRPRRVVAAVLRDRAVWIIGLIGLLMTPFDETLLGFTIALVERERGATPAVATVVAIVGAGGGLLACTVLARRWERADDHAVLFGSVAAMVAGVVAIAVVPVVGVVIATCFVVATGLNLAWLALQHRSLTLRPGQAGTTQAVLGVIDSGGFWMPAAIGALADGAGLVAGLASYALLGAVLLGLVRLDSRRNRGQSQQESRQPH